MSISSDSVLMQVDPLSLSLSLALSRSLSLSLSLSLCVCVCVRDKKDVADRTLHDTPATGFQVLTPSLCRTNSQKSVHSDFVE